MPRRIPTSLLIAASALFSCVVDARGQAFTRLVSFGDSLSDVGNTSSLTFGVAPGSNYYNGRYSNGPLWNEDLSTSLNLGAVVASRKSGLDYATGGSRTGSGNVSPFPFVSLPNAGTQIDSYLSNHTPGSDDLVTVWTGANDFIDGQTDPSIPAANVKAHVQRLLDAGVRNLLVINLPPLGETPRYRTTANRATMDSLTAQFDSLVSSSLDMIAAASPNATIYRADMPTVFTSAFANPAAYGLTNVTDPALKSDGTVVPNPDQYLFYDDIHPTRVGHALIGNVVFDTVTTRTWAMTSNNGTWTAASNWAQHRVPDATSNVRLTGTAFTTSLTASTAIRRLAVGDGTSGPTLDLATATLSVHESLVLDGGRLRMSLASNGNGSVQVAGSASLSGTIAIAFADGYVGLPGRTATLLTYASEAGTPTFANDTGYAGLSFVPTFGSTSLSVRLTATPGDADLNANVGFGDLLALARHYGAASNATWLDGDFNGDAAVNFTDLLQLARNYGTAAAGDAAALPQSVAGDWALAQSLVPEPTIASVLLLGVMRQRRVRRAG